LCKQPSKVICDTNVLLDGLNAEDFEKIVIPIVVVEELDKIKQGENSGLAHRARKATRMIEAAENVEILSGSTYSLPIDFLNSIADNRILSYATDVVFGREGYVFLSNDLNVRLKARSLHIPCESYNQKKLSESYAHNGWLELDSVRDAESLAKWEEGNRKENLWNLKLNEYIAIKDDGKVVDKLRFTKNGFKKVLPKEISSITMNKIKPLNVEQEFLFDMLQDNSITIKCCTGTWGTGKDFCMLAQAFSMLDTKKVQKIVWVRNTIEVKNSKPVGFLKGTLDEKLLPYAQVMCDHIGGKMGLEFLIQNGKVELQHLGFIRGRNIENSIIYCSEAENMTKEHIQLIMGRIGVGSYLFLNGDLRQTDETIFEQNNGLGKMIETLNGHPRFAHVKLSKTERSETAAMADLLD